MEIKVKLKEVFSAFMLAFSKAYDDPKKIFLSRTNEQIFGYNAYSTNAYSLSVIIKKEGRFNISGKKLYEVKSNYNQALNEKRKDMLISKKYWDALLNYIDLDSGEKALLRYCSENKVPTSIFELKPIFIKGDKKIKRLKKEHINEIVKYHSNLDYIAAQSPFHYWFNEYQTSTDDHPVIMRLVLTIEKEKDGDIFLVKLKNTGAPFTNFIGSIIFSTEHIFICDLKGKQKKHTIYVSCQPNGDSEIMTAMGIKHNSDGKMFAYSALIEPTSAKNASAKIFSKEKEGFLKINKSIRKYFKSKSFNFIRTTRRFEHLSLYNWVIQKEIERDEYIEYDLFVSATILSLNRKIELYKSLESDLIEVINKYSDSKDKKLKKEVTKILDNHILGKPFNGSISFDLKKFQAAVSNLVKNLEEKLNLKVHNSRHNVNISSSQYLDPASVLERDFKKLQKSRAYMLICPYPNISSSVWILLGLALAMGKNVFLIVEDIRKDVPFIVQGGNPIKKTFVHYVKNFEDIENAYKWIETNEFDSKYMKDIFFS